MAFTSVCLSPLQLNKMPPTKQEIRKIARRTTDIIESKITANVCLFGSAASSLWADIGRDPHVRRATQLYYGFLFFFLTQKAVSKT